MGELSFCLVSTFYPPAGFGGDAVHVQRLARGLVQRGHRVRVVHAPVAFRALGGRTAEEPVDDGVEVIAAPMGRAATLGTYLTGHPVSYRRQLRDLLSGFDVVHFHNPSLLGGPGALGLGGALRLYTTHEHWLVCPTHVLFRNDQEVCTRRTCMTCTIRHKRPPQPWRATPLLRHAVDQLDVLLCPSRFTAEVHRRHFPNADIEVLPLAAPSVQPRPAPSAIGERPMFLYAGRLEPIKGVDRLVAAFPAVRGADLLVVGDGSLADGVQRSAAAHPQIQFAGRVTSEEVLDLCQRAAAVVVPSSGYETFGGVAVEAMAVGTPVVVRHLGPLPELVECGGGVTFADDVALVAVLQRLVDEPALRQRLSTEAPLAVAARFSEDRFFSRYFGIVRQRAAARGLHDLVARASEASR